MQSDESWFVRHSLLCLPIVLTGSDHLFAAHIVSDRLRTRSLVKITTRFKRRISSKFGQLLVYCFKDNHLHLCDSISTPTELTLMVSRLQDAKRVQQVKRKVLNLNLFGRAD
jgi:hypothetical protein